MRYHCLQIHGHFIGIEGNTKSIYNALLTGEVKVEEGEAATVALEKDDLEGVIRSQSEQRFRPCPLLPVGTTAFDKNFHGVPYIKKEFDFKRLIDGIKKDYGDEVAEIEIIYECQFKNKMKTPGTKEYQFFNSPEASLRPNSKKPPPMVIRDGLRGGCVELMCLSAEADIEYDVFYQDINRLVHFLVKVFIVNVTIGS